MQTNRLIEADQALQAAKAELAAAREALVNDIKTQGYDEAVPAELQDFVKLKRNTAGLRETDESIMDLLKQIESIERFNVAQFADRLYEIDAQIHELQLLRASILRTPEIIELETQISELEAIKEPPLQVVFNRSHYNRQRDSNEEN